MSTGLLSSLLNAQSQTPTPAGQKKQVVMVPRELIMANPDNKKIYIVGDVSGLKDDIRENGVRQPLEVVRYGDRYKLIGGERRLTACKQLADEGDKRFESLPCFILDSKGPEDDKIALITANATARDLTDGERVAQYEALKDALTLKKKRGELKGKVRDECCRILGLSAGAAARLNIVCSCENETIKERLMAGELMFMEAVKLAQEYTHYTKQKESPKEPEEAPKESPKPASAETIPKNPDFDEWNLPPECRVAVEKAHREAAENYAAESAAKPVEPEKPAADLAAQARAKPFPKDISNRGLNTLIKLAQKTVGDNAPWALHLCEPKFRVEYYTQSLPGGATLWMRLDEIAKERERSDYADYAITLQDNSFYTDGWIRRGCIVDDLVKWFNLTDD